MRKSIVNIKYEEKFVFIMSELIKWHTVQAVINYIVRFCFILFFEFKLTLLCDM